MGCKTSLSFYNFAQANSRRDDFARRRSSYWEGALHFETRLLTLCFWLSGT